MDILRSISNENPKTRLIAFLRRQSKVVEFAFCLVFHVFNCPESLLAKIVTVNINSS